MIPSLHKWVPESGCKTSSGVLDSDQVMPTVLLTERSSLSETSHLGAWVCVRTAKVGSAELPYTVVTGCRLASARIAHFTGCRLASARIAHFSLTVVTGCRLASARIAHGSYRVQASQCPDSTFYSVPSARIV